MTENLFVAGMASVLLGIEFRFLHVFISFTVIYARLRRKLQTGIVGPSPMGKGLTAQQLPFPGAPRESGLP
jgi:hypothetical protein